MGKGQSGSRADSVAYLSHDYNGLSFMGQLRQYPKTLVNDEQYVFQLAGQYRLPALTLGLGLVDGNSKTPNPDTQETLVGVSAVYQMSNVLTLSGLLENQKNRGSSREHLAVSVVYDYGQGEIYGSLGVDWNDEDYLGAGISWKFSKPMSVFAEYGRGDVMPAGNGNSVLTAGVRYDF
jgi:predicted porin